MDKKSEDITNLSRWREAVENHSIERVKRACISTFHRLRVVQSIILHENEILLGQELKDVSTEKLEAQTMELLSIEDSNKRKHTEGYGNEKNYDRFHGYDYVPYDVSTQTIKDGVSWYLKLKEELQNEDFLRLSIWQLVELMYQASREGKFVEERMRLSGISDSFGNFVASIAKGKTIKVDKTEDLLSGRNENITDGVDGDLSKSMGMKFENQSQTINKWIRGLGEDFNKLYENTVEKEN